MPAANQLPADPAARWALIVRAFADVHRMPAEQVNAMPPEYAAALIRHWLLTNRNTAVDWRLIEVLPEVLPDQPPRFDQASERTAFVLFALSVLAVFVLFVFFGSVL